MIEGSFFKVLGLGPLGKTMSTNGSAVDWRILKNEWVANFDGEASPLKRLERGSNPRRPTKYSTHVVYRFRTLPFQGGEEGSTPFVSTKILGL